MRPNERGGGGRRKEIERKREEVLPTVGSRNRLVAREIRGGIDRAFGCIGFRGAKNSCPESGLGQSPK